MFGTIQGVASFLLPMLRYGDLGSPDLLWILAGLALVYCGGWFIPALIISDLFMLRRTLSPRDFRRYTLLIAITTLVMGLLMSGMMVILGYPMTACAILGYGFLKSEEPR